MLKEGVKAGEIKIASFEGDTAKPLADMLNNWLANNEYNEIYDITFQRSNNISAFVVYKRVEKPSGEPPQVIKY